jgi:hypothetical protein
VFIELHQLAPVRIMLARRCARAPTCVLHFEASIPLAAVS